MKLWFTCLAAALFGLSCRKSPTPSAPQGERATGQEWFQDVTAQKGLDFVHDAGQPGRYFMPEHIGSGGALLDYDNDGRLDIYLVQNAGPNSPSSNRLFHQEADGRFKDVSTGSGLDVTGYGMGVAVGDVNNDGWPDVLLTEYGRVRLFLNQRRGKFRDVTEAAGLENPYWATSAAFFDYDRDGWLDLVVANYVDYDPTHPCYDATGAPEFCGPQGFPGSVTKLFHNLGGRSAGSAAPGRWEDVTVPSGLFRHPGPALGVLCADFDGDRWPDIFVADDAKPNRLFINQHNGTFSEEGTRRGLAYNAMGQAPANMGIAAGDVDGDGQFDIFVTHLTEEYHSLWMQAPRGLFQDRTTGAGLTARQWRGTGFGAVLADFDNDGALDLALVNGRIKREGTAFVVPPSGGSGARDQLKPALQTNTAGSSQLMSNSFAVSTSAGSSAHEFWLPYAQRSQLFANDGSGRFSDVSLHNAAFCTRPIVGRGLVCGDLDNDGALDLLVTSIAGPARLYRNVAPPRWHWLSVRATDPALGGRDAYGAEVMVQAGGRSWWRLLNSAYSFLSSNDPRVHFGLGPAANIESIRVIWPDGTEEEFPGGAPDRLIVLSKGAGRRAAP
jgi:hypothetical protein